MYTSCIPTNKTDVSRLYHGVREETRENGLTVKGRTKPQGTKGTSFRTSSNAQRDPMTVKHTTVKGRDQILSIVESRNWVAKRF